MRFNVESQPEWIIRYFGTDKKIGGGWFSNRVRISMSCLGDSMKIMTGISNKKWDMGTKVGSLPTWCEE